MASAVIGVALSVCRYALEHDLDLAAAEQLAAVFTQACARNMDSVAVTAIEDAVRRNKVTKSAGKPA